MPEETSTATGTGLTFEQEREQWRQEYLKGVTARIGSIPYETSINPREGKDDDLAPPCFFYGTLMALPVLYRVIFQTPRPPPELTANIQVRPAILPNHKCRQVKHADYPGMISTTLTNATTNTETTTASSEEVTYGSFVTGITKRGLRNLDRFEGSQYRLVTVKVKVLTQRRKEGEGKEEVWEEKEAMTYLFIAGSDRLDERKWRFAEYMKRQMMYWAGIREEDPEIGEYDDLGYWKDATTTVPVHYDEEKYALPETDPGWV